MHMASNACRGRSRLVAIGQYASLSCDIFDDFPVSPMHNIWIDTYDVALLMRRVYVVQTVTKGH